MIPVKVCGITRLQDALLAIKYGATAVGFIFAPSPRQVSVATAASIVCQLPPLVTRVGVFVNETPSSIQAIMECCQLDLAQLHGDESIATVNALAGKAIKAFRAGEDQPSQAWRDANVRAILVDAYVPGVPGGTGQSFNWELFREYRKLGHPLILAGGLNATNIREAIRLAQPDAVDLSSGLEAKPGIKDESKLAEFAKELYHFKELI